MAKLEIPESVGAVQLAAVGAGRVLLRSDMRLSCTACLRTDLFADMTAGGGCWHMRDVWGRGVTQTRNDNAGRVYPVFVWHRGAGVVEAQWPDGKDPYGVIEAVRTALLDTTRGARAVRLDDDLCRLVAETTVLGLQRRGYVVVPEWASRMQPKAGAALTPGRGARVYEFDSEDEGVDESRHD